MCKIARATNPNELLRTVARSDPDGVACLALRTRRNPHHIGELNSRSGVARKSQSTRSKQTQAKRQDENDDQVIVEDVAEVDDVSLSNAKYYDTNDPDVAMINRMMDATKTSGRVAVTAVREENSNASDEQYVKDADEEDDDVYKEFGSSNRMIVKESRKGSARTRTIQSAHPPALGRRLGTAEAKRDPAAGRPTTVPNDLVASLTADNCAESAGRRKNRRLRKKRLTQSARPNTFRIVGRTATLCPRSPTATRKGGDGGQKWAPVQLRRVASSRPATAAVGRPTGDILSLSTTKSLSKLYATTMTTNGSGSFKSPVSMTIEEEPQPAFDPESTRTIQQLNVLTEQPAESGRPSTAQPQPGFRKHFIQPSVADDRPMSAQVPSRRPYLQRTMNTTANYVATSYMRPFGAHRRPISAAVNVSASRDRTLEINPERTREKYLKYLKELESGAKQFVIEEDVETVAGQKPTSLLQQAKKQRRHVRLKKSIMSGKKKKLALPGKATAKETMSRFASCAPG